MLAVLALLVTPAPDCRQLGEWVADIGRLGHVRFSVRELATARLSRADWSATPLLRDAARSPDPETAQRAAAALGMIVERELTALRPLPEIDAAWRIPSRHCYDERLAPKPMAACLTSALSDGVPPDRHFAAYYRACERWVRGKLTEGASPRLLRLLLADMHRRDADFLKGSHDSLIVDAGAYRRGK